MRIQLRDGKTSPGYSKIALLIIAAYLFLALAALSLPLLAKKGESLAGVYLMPFALPWSIVLGKIIDSVGINSIVFIYAFLLLGISFNAIVLYLIVNTFSRKLPAIIRSRSGKVESNILRHAGYLYQCSMRLQTYEVYVLRFRFQEESRLMRRPGRG